MGGPQYQLGFWRETKPTGAPGKCEAICGGDWLTQCWERRPDTICHRRAGERSSLSPGGKACGAGALTPAGRGRGTRDVPAQGWRGDTPSLHLFVASGSARDPRGPAAAGEATCLATFSRTLPGTLRNGTPVPGLRQASELDAYNPPSHFAAPRGVSQTSRF